MLTRNAQNDQEPGHLGSLCRQAESEKLCGLICEASIGQKPSCLCHEANMEGLRGLQGHQA